MRPAVHVGEAMPERSILFSASLCCCCVQFRTRLHCCMWIQSCRHVCACVCVCLCERVLLSVCRRGVVVAHCTVANLLCMWMRNSFPECVCVCVWVRMPVFFYASMCVWVWVCMWLCFGSQRTKPIARKWLLARGSCKNRAAAEAGAEQR